MIEFHNYYEDQVVEEIHKQMGSQLVDTNFVADVACVALNQLPPRYVRFDADMAFFLTPTEAVEMEKRVTAVVKEARAFIEKRGPR